MGTWWLTKVTLPWSFVGPNMMPEELEIRTVTGRGYEKNVNWTLLESGILVGNFYFCKLSAFVNVVMMLF